MRVSNCCGAYPKGNEDCDDEDRGICSRCREHCEYVDEDDEENYKPMTDRTFLSVATDNIRAEQNRLVDKINGAIAECEMRIAKNPHDNMAKEWLAELKRAKEGL